MMPEWITDHEVKGESGTSILLYVQPGASKTRFKGEFASTPPRLKLSVSASPTEGAANEMVLRFISEIMGVAKSRVHILSGDTSRQKNIWIAGVDALTSFVRLDFDPDAEVEEEEESKTKKKPEKKSRASKS